MDRIQELNDQIAERDEIEKRVESCIRVVFGRIAELEAAVVVLKRRLVVASQKLKSASLPVTSIAAADTATEVPVYHWRLKSHGFLSVLCLNNEALLSRWGVM